MSEVFTGRPETQKASGTVIDFEAARQKRHAGEKSQRQRPLTSPPSREDRQERQATTRQQHIKEELARITEQPTVSQTQQEADREQEVDALVNKVVPQ
jgi:hypothetical protein